MSHCRSFVLPLLVLAGCAASTVVVRVDDTTPETREVQKMDCGSYDTRGEALRVGVDFGVLFGIVRGGPYVEQARVAGVNWDRSVHHMVAQYKELCSRYNTGGVSLAAYNTRLAEIDQLWAEAQGIRQSIDDTIRGHGKESFGELERDTGDKAASPDQERQRIAGAIDSLVMKLGAR
jgi:hypothetical protein